MTIPLGQGVKNGYLVRNQPGVLDICNVTPYYFGIKLTETLVAHRKVAARRSSVSRQMASIYLSNNTGLFTFFARGEDVIITSDSK